MANPGDQASDEGESIHVAVTATDPEGKPLVYRATNLPAGLTIDPKSGVIEGFVDPNAATRSPYDVKLRVSDGGAAVVTAFRWVVRATNQPPAFTRPADQIATEGDTVSLAIPAIDHEGDPIAWSALNLPPGLAIDPATGTIAGTIAVPAADASPYTVTVETTDGSSLANATFSWTVKPAPPASIAGRLLVTPDNTLEVEPNQTLATAQPISSTQKVAGAAARDDPGFPISVGAIEDLYRLNAAEPVRMTLTIAEDDLDETDLDLFLLDTSGTIIEASQGYVDTEILETGAGDFVIGVRAFAGSSAYVLSIERSADVAAAGSRAVLLGAEFVPGEVIAKTRGTGKEKTAARAGLAVREDLPGRIQVLQAPLELRAGTKKAVGAPLKEFVGRGKENGLRALTFRAIERLSRDPDVEYAEPNYVRRAARTPNDPLFRRQWNHTLINLPAAWDLETGAGAVIVAVIDTGVLLSHPDLDGRVVPGYDFIADPAAANDGDGRDADPDDPGDDPRGASSTFHGSHVAGILAAETNNGTGIAGVTWATRIMPLRVLGVGGGTDADIAQAILFAAGLPNASGTTPPEIARIINLSLGNPSFGQTLNNAVQAASAAGAIIVAAAGNGGSAAPFYPASLDGVVSVAAVGADSIKAPYSNYGPTIDVAAPGGNVAVDLSGDGLPDGILSTIAHGPGDFDYGFYQGTSMAAPHVAGVIALMLAISPGLTPREIDELLAGTHPATATRIARDLGRPGRDDLYGHGLIDASQAIKAALESVGSSGSSPAQPDLAVSPAELDFRNFLEIINLNVSNAGGGALKVTSVSADKPWISVSPPSGTAPLALRVAVNRMGLTDGEHRGSVTIVSNATVGSPRATVPVRVLAGGTALGNVGSVRVLLVDVATFETADETTADFANAYHFFFPAAPDGTYFIFAGTDRDGNGLICEREDACGFFPDPIAIARGRDVEGVDILVGELVSPQAALSRAAALPR